MNRSCVGGVGARLGAVGVILAMTSYAGAQERTGPTEQRVPWQAVQPLANPPLHNLNSVVRINTPLTRNSDGAAFIGRGTGSIIGVRPGNDGYWLCVLTADHNLAAPAGFTRNGNITVGFGDNDAMGTRGGADNREQRGQVPANMGGLGGVDLGLLGIRYGNYDALLNGIRALQMGSMGNSASDWNSTIFTEYGYGGTGTWANGGMTRQNSDGNKRFQDNIIRRTEAVNDGTYTYTGVQFDFNPAAAQVPNAPPQLQLASSGISFAGDSGGPYMRSTTILGDLQVPAMDRMTAGVPNWTAGPARVDLDTIYAVHTRGSTNDVNVGGLVEYTQYLANGSPDPAHWNWGSAVPLLPNYIQWAQGYCMTIPAPSGLVLLTMSGCFAFRRRRA